MTRWWWCTSHNIDSHLLIYILNMSSNVQLVTPQISGWLSPRSLSGSNAQSFFVVPFTLVKVLIFRVQVVLGLPFHLRSREIHSFTLFGSRFLCILLTCPNHFFRFLCMSSKTFLLYPWVFLFRPPTDLLRSAISVPRIFFTLKSSSLLNRISALLPKNAVKNSYHFFVLVIRSWIVV